MKNNKLTFWTDFKNNYLKTSIALTVFFIAVLLHSLFNQNEHWYYSFFFLFLAWVFIPIAGFIAYKNKKK